MSQPPINQPPGGNGGSGHHHRRQPWWPIALIVVGLLVLAGNLGVGLGPVWGFIGNLWRFWPVALIAVGADMITRGRYRLLVAAVAIGVVVVLAAYGGTSARSGTPITISEPKAGATSARITLDLGVGPLNLSAVPNGTDAVWGTVREGGSERVTVQSSRRGSLIDVTIRARQRGWPPIFWGGGNGGAWNLSLDQDLPTNLVIDSGVGSVTLDLRRAKLTGLDLDAGVGQVSLTLPESGGYSGKIDGGVGALTVFVPQTLAMEVTVDTGVGAVNVDGGFLKSGGSYLSPAAVAGSPVTVRLVIDVGVGSLNLRSVR